MDMVQLMALPPHNLLLSIKHRMASPFWCRLISRLSWKRSR